jgi:hypothetical protein
MRTAFIWLFLIICQPAFAQSPEHIPQPFATQGRDCGRALRAIYSPALADSQSAPTADDPHPLPHSERAHQSTGNSVRNVIISARAMIDAVTPAARSPALKAAQLRN